MKTMIGSIVILLSLTGIIYYQAAATDESNASLPKKTVHLLLSANPLLLMLRGKKLRLEVQLIF